MCSEHVKCTLLDHYVHPYTQVSYGVIINLNRYENCMLHTTTCLDYYGMNQGMFVTRGLPTCKMLIRKKLYSFMMCIAKSGNTILQSILNSDALYTSQMYQHWRSVLYINHF